MTFKNIQALMMIALLQFSCSEFLKGKPPKDDTLKVSKESVSCMNDASEKWKIFLDSAADEKVIDKAFECVDSTMNEFQTRVEGKADPNSFTTEELQKVFDKFVSGTQIPSHAIKDLLVLKAAILGGAPDKITKKEISELRKYLELIKVEAKALMPYVQLLKFKKEKSPFSKKMLQDGFGQLNVSLKNLFRGSQFYRSDYQLTDLQKLVENLKIVDKDQSHLISLAGLMKGLLGGAQALQSESDYLTFIDNLTEVLRLYSFHIQGYVQFAIEKSQVMEDTLNYLDNWISLFENSLQFKRSKVISVETLDPLIAEISNQGLFPIDIKTETLLQFYKILVVRAFDSGENGDAFAFTGLTKAHILRIRREIAIYKLYAQMLSQFDLQTRVPLAKVQERVRQFNTKNIVWLNRFDETSKQMIIAAFDELRSEFISDNPVIYRFDKMIITLNQDVWDQNWQDLSRALYVKMLARELMVGWGHSQTKLMAQSYLTEAQLSLWYSDFRQFGVEVKTFDPRSLNSGPVSFKQANLLTLSADGNDLMNFSETVQYLNMLISGGGHMTTEIQRGFEESKCQLDDKDVFGNPWVDEKCALRNFRTSYTKYFATFSILTSYLSRLSEEKFYAFFDQLLDVTRVNPALKGQRIETADLRNMSILLHYIETLFAAFDKDKNWNLSADEIRIAYPRFKNFAQKYATDHAKEQIEMFNGKLAQTVGGYGCYSEEDLIRESFIFMVFNGQAPQKADLNNIPCFLRRPLIDFKGEVNRTRMINTFKILKSVLGS